MKELKTLLLVFVGLGLFSFTVNQFQEAPEVHNEFEDVGIIKQSFLKPNQFNKTQSGTWVLLDGSQIEKDTKLFQLLEETHDLDILTLKDGNYYLPNALGTFIRCSNVNGEGKDPDQSRKVGSLQEDTFEKHQHSTERNVFGQRNAGFPTQEDMDPGGWGGYMKVKTHSVGDTETRPVNISMYTYIKISN